MDGLTTVTYVDYINQCRRQDFCNNGCSAGYYFPENDCWECNACPLGSFCQGSEIYTCLRGEYQDEYAQTSCKSCTARSSYQDNTGAAGCKPCSSCAAGQRIAQYCTLTSDTICETCLPGSVSTNPISSSCSLCSDGKYQDKSGGSSCETQPVCVAGEYTEVVGNNAVKTVCKACGSPWTTLSGSYTACTSCVAGTYQDTTVNPATCTTCACTGGGERYILCPAGSTAKQCPYCTGTPTKGFCEVGKQPSYRCDGRDTVDATCVACPAGSHKPNRDQQWCEECPTGFYKLGPASINSCTACTNRNPTNQNLAFYTAWTSSPASNTCPWYVWFGAACYGTCRD